MQDHRFSPLEKKTVGNDRFPHAGWQFCSEPSSALLPAGPAWKHLPLHREKGVGGRSFRGRRELHSWVCGTEAGAHALVGCGRKGPKPPGTVQESKPEVRGATGVPSSSFQLTLGLDCLCCSTHEPEPPYLPRCSLAGTEPGAPRHPPATCSLSMPVPHSASCCPCEAQLWSPLLHHSPSQWHGAAACGSA